MTYAPESSESHLPFKNKLKPPGGSSRFDGTALSVEERSVSHGPGKRISGSNQREKDGGSTAAAKGKQKKRALYRAAKGLLETSK